MLWVGIYVSSAVFSTVSVVVYTPGVSEARAMSMFLALASAAAAVSAAGYGVFR